jgi:hypothetical protein
MIPNGLPTSVGNLVNRDFCDTICRRLNQNDRSSIPAKTAVMASKPMKTMTNGVLVLLYAAIFQIAFPPPTFAVERHDTPRVVSEYRVEYKLRNLKTGATGEAHITYVRAESEANVVVELRRQNPGKDVVILSLTAK